MDEPAPGSLLPAEGLPLTVACRSGEGRARPHAALLRPDWSLETPHDLDLERIGVALGGTLTCVDLADRQLPAARDLLEHLHRTAPAAIVQHGPMEWGAAAPASGCACDTDRWQTVVDAAAHVRSLTHWVHVHGGTRGALVRTLTLLERSGLDLDAGNPVPRTATSGLLAEPDATQLLWDAGVPFDLVPELCRRFSPSGDPIPTRVVIAHVYAPQEWALLEAFVPHGPVVLAWAAQHRTARDLRRPDERVAWVAAGIPLPTIDRIFTGMAYDLVHARAYASATGTDLATAAGVLGRWQAAGTTPAVKDLVDLHAAGPHAATSPGCAPARPAVERTVGLAAKKGLRASPEQAALALARTGTAPDAAALIARTTAPTFTMEVP